jgi:hypothetical protein
MAGNSSIKKPQKFTRWFLDHSDLLSSLIQTFLKNSVHTPLTLIQTTVNLKLPENPWWKRSIGLFGVSLSFFLLRTWSASQGGWSSNLHFRSGHTHLRMK